MKLEVKDASIGYKKQVLSSNINMASEPGMVTAILGQNGCGKTTFVKSLMKLIPWCGGFLFLIEQMGSFLHTCRFGAHSQGSFCWNRCV